MDVQRVPCGPGRMVGSCCSEAQPDLTVEEERIRRLDSEWPCYKEPESITVDQRCVMNGSPLLA